MTIAYTTDRAVPGASVGGARHAGQCGWVVRGKAKNVAGGSEKRWPKAKKAKKAKNVGLIMMID